MSVRIPFCAAFFFLLAGTLLLAVPALAAEPQPGDACSGTDNFMHVGGPENPGTGYLLVCNGSNWKTIQEWDTTSGSSLFQVDNDAGSCTAAKLGRIRYDGTAAWEYCNGTTWTNIVSGVALSALTAATASNTILNGAYNQVWNWALTGAAADGFTFGENVASTGGAGNQSILKATNLASSTAIPLLVDNAGAGVSFKVTDDGTDTDATPFVVDASGNTGIGTETPAVKLDVVGEVKIGNTAIACSGTTEGAMRYNTTSDCIELCNGTAWACVAVAACSDATPAVFDFNDLVNQSVSTLVTSNILQITGLSCTVNVAISGEGSPQYRVCSDSGCSTVLVDWKSGTDLLANNNYLQLRLTTSAAGGDIYSATVVVGTSAEVWNATPTGDCTGSPAAGTVCADGTVYAGLSPDGNVKMYVTRCDAGQTWDGTACTGTRQTYSWNNGTANWTTTGYVSAITGKSNSAGISALADAGSIHFAARYCEDLSQDGQTDWYLPAKNELNVMYGDKTTIGNFLTNGSNYWSSSETNNGSAWYQRFSDGFQGSNIKLYAYYVRCARR